MRDGAQHSLSERGLALEVRAQDLPGCIGPIVEEHAKTESGLSRAVNWSGGYTRTWSERPALQAVEIVSSAWALAPEVSWMLRSVVCTGLAAGPICRPFRRRLTPGKPAVPQVPP